MVVSTQTEDFINNRNIKKAFPNLIFNPKYHTYLVNGKQFPSVSSQVKKFYVPFDRSVSRWTAKKKGITQKEVLRDWDDIKNNSLAIGNRVHDFAETYLTATIVNADDMMPSCNKELGVVQFMMDLDPKYEIISTELMMYHKDYKYAGTADFIVFNKETGNYIIGDWKTNNDLYKNYAKNKLLYPFDSLLDNPLNKYKIQLNLYQLAMENADFSIEEKWLIWLTENRNKYYKKIIIPDHTSKLKKYYDK